MTKKILLHGLRRSLYPQIMELPTVCAFVGCLLTSLLGIQEILPSWLTPATAARTEHNATQTTTTQQTEQTSTPTNGGVEKQTPMPTAGSKSSTPSVPRNIVPPTGSTGKNFPNSFSAFNPDTKRVEHVCRCWLVSF